MKLLRNSKIAVKLWLMILPVFIALLYILFQFSFQMKSLNKEAKSSYYDTLYLNSSLLLSADRDFYEATLTERTLVTSTSTLDAETKNRYLSIYNADCERIIANINKVMSNIKPNNELYNEFKHSKTQLTMSHLYDQFTDQFSEWQSTYDPNTGEGYIVAKNAMFDGIRDEIKTMTELLDEYSVKSQADMQDYINQTIGRIFFIFIVASLLMAFICIYIIRFIGSNTKALTSNMNSLASNDLSFVPHQSNSKDELGTLSNSVNILVYSLRDITGKLINTSNSLSESSHNMKATSDEVTSSIFEVAKTINDIAEGAASQAEDTQKLVYEINNLGEAVRTSSESTKELTQTASSIMSISQEGIETVTNLDDINVKNQHAFQSIFQTIDTANKDAGKIVEATALISNIADQINLISLNAAIEASRAGDAGRGFAVIANEIYKLSEQTQSSTTLIDNMLNGIRDNIFTASLQSKEAEHGVIRQTKSIAETKDKYLSIVSHLNRINNEIYSLETVTDKISQSRSIISELSSNSSAISEEYAASTEETSAATQQVLTSMTTINQVGTEVDDLVEEVRNIINKFKL